MTTATIALPVRSSLTFALVLFLVSCGGTASTPAPASPIEPTPTATPSPTPSPTPIGTPFELDAVLAIAGISDLVGEGSLEITAAADDGQAGLQLDGSAPVVDGEICMFCMGTLVLGPGAAAAADAMFTSNPGEGTHAEFHLTLGGPMFPEDATVFIVAGDGGATLEKVGSGFRLIEGEAWLVTDRSLIDPG